MVIYHFCYVDLSHALSYKALSSTIVIHSLQGLQSRLSIRVSIFTSLLCVLQHHDFKFYCTPYPAYVLNFDYTLFCVVFWNFNSNFNSMTHFDLPWKWFICNSQDELIVWLAFCWFIRISFSPSLEKEINRMSIVNPCHKFKGDFLTFRSRKRRGRTLKI